MRAFREMCFAGVKKAQCDPKGARIHRHPRFPRRVEEGFLRSRSSRCLPNDVLTPPPFTIVSSLFPHVRFQSDSLRQKPDPLPPPSTTSVYALMRGFAHTSNIRIFQFPLLLARTSSLVILVVFPTTPCSTLSISLARGSFREILR